MSRSSKKHNRAASNIDAKNVGIISINELREIREKTIKGKQHDAAIIDQGEVDRIRKTVIYKTPE